jgi:hypothetical protein
MLVMVDNDLEREMMKRDPRSWAPTLDVASSIRVTIFSDDQKLRIIARIGKISIRSKKPPPKVYHLHVRKSDIHDDQRTRSVDVSAIRSRGEVLLQIESMRLAKVDADSKFSTGMNGLVYRIAWTPAHLAEKPLFLGNVVMISPEDRILQHYGDQLDPHFTELKKLEQLIH